MITIGDLLENKGREVISVTPEITIFAALQVFKQNKIGSLLVIDQTGDTKGIITERDILYWVHEHYEQIKTIQVTEVMTKDVVVGNPDDDLDYAMSIMTRFRFRHMPVIGNGKLVGIISIGDVVKALKSQKEYDNKMLHDYITGKYPG
jgi:CBS domain-containing protein